MTSTVRYYAQRALTGEMLDDDLQLTTDGPEYELSGPGSLRASIAPDLGQLRAADGHLLLEEWGTLIHYEEAGEIRWSGIVISSTFEGSKWRLDAAGYSSYPHGIPYSGTYRGVNADPVDIMRELWGNVQNHPDGNLGITVAGSTPVRLGSITGQRAEEAAVAADAAKKAHTTAGRELTRLREAATAARKVATARRATRTQANKALTAAKKTLTAAKRAKDPAAIKAADTAVGTAQGAVNAAAAEVRAAEAVVKTRVDAVNAQAPIVNRLKAASDAAAEKKNTTADAAREDGGSYDLLWWETPDAGRELQRLADDTPFDWVERHRWANPTTRTDLVHEIVVGYPRLGRRRHDLSFVQGDNIVTVVAPQRDGDDYANEVIGIGAGEGAGALRRTTAVRNGRLRRTHVLTAKDTTTPGQLDAQLRTELQTRLNTLTVDEITVRDHDHAPIGSWDLGDDILVQATIPWLGDFEEWHRVIAWRRQGTTRAVLTLQRSDTFTYGG